MRADCVHCPACRRVWVLMKDHCRTAAIDLEDLCRETCPYYESRDNIIFAVMGEDLNETALELGYKQWDISELMADKHRREVLLNAIAKGMGSAQDSIIQTALDDALRPDLEVEGQ